MKKGAPLCVGASSKVRIGHLGRRYFANVYLALVLVEFNNAILECKERVVVSATHIVAGVEFGSNLTNQNTAGGYFLATETLYATALRITVAAVAG